MKAQFCRGSDTADTDGCEETVPAVDLEGFSPPLPTPPLEEMSSSIASKSRHAPAVFCPSLLLLLLLLVVLLLFLLLYFKQPH